MTTVKSHPRVSNKGNFHNVRSHNRLVHYYRGNKIPAGAYKVDPIVVDNIKQNILNMERPDHIHPSKWERFKSWVKEHPGEFATAVGLVGLMGLLVGTGVGAVGVVAEGAAIQSDMSIIIGELLEFRAGLIK